MLLREIFIMWLIFHSTLLYVDILGYVTNILHHTCTGVGLEATEQGKT
jgi:hypothetical protein